MHDAERDEELEHELIDGLANVDRLIRDLGEGEAGGSSADICFCFGLQRLAEVETVPALLHDDAEHQRRLAVVADQEGGRILVAALDLGDIGQLERAPARYDRRVADLLEIVIGAVEADEDLRPVGVDRSGRRDRVLALERGEDVAGADAERRQPGIGELDEDAFRALAQDIDLLDARHMQQALAQSFRPRAVSRRGGMPGAFDGIEREGDVGVFVVDERAHGALRQVARLVAQLLARLIELARGPLAGGVRPSGRPSSGPAPAG